MSFQDKCDSNVNSKPKIWSLAATAINDKPKNNSQFTQPSQSSLHLNVHSNGFPNSTSNLTNWYQQNVPYSSVNSYGTHYIPQLSGHHFQHSSIVSLPPQVNLLSFYFILFF